MSKVKAAIPLDEMNKQIANNCRNNAQKLREEVEYLEKVADIIDANKDYDQYELLKEFVEWYNCRLQKILVHEQELYESATQQNHIENATFYLGEKTMLERLIYWLSQDLENFIKEIENG